MSEASKDLEIFTKTLFILNGSNESIYVFLTDAHEKSLFTNFVGSQRIIFFNNKLEEIPPIKQNSNYNLSPVIDESILAKFVLLGYNMNNNFLEINDFCKTLEENREKREEEYLENLEEQLKHI